MFSFSNKWVSLALTLAATLPLGISASAASDEAALVAALRDAPTAVDRINLLPDDEDFEFDFFDPTKAATVGAGGKIILANSGTFPAVIGSNSAMAVGILDACSMNTPHTHPRATEMQFSVNGTIRTGMITENNARFILTEIPPGSMTIFPQGSIHFQVNDGCEPLMFVSSFNSEDPGALQIAQRFLGLPPDIVGATFGGLGVVQVAGLESQIPDNVAIATDACLQRCGLTRPKQPTSQLQPIVSGNAFPSPTGGASYTYSTYNSGYQYNTKAASAAAGADYAYQTTTTTAKGNNYGNGNTYTTPKAQSYAMATATVSHGTSKWTTVYTSYAGSAYPTYAPSGPVNHLIKVGLNSTGGSALQFTPSNISAALGDTVTFEFHAKNHTVTQSSFPEPCKKLAETSTTGQIGFESGFVPVNETQTSNFPTFTITVNDTAPIWGYCGQQGPPIHCQSGMVFSINAVESGPNNFEAFKTLALDSGSQTLNGVTCPSADKDGSPLESAATSTDSDGNVFASCTYSSAGVCTFFSDGSFSSGSSTCPAGLPQASGFGTSPSSSGVNCPPTDKNGSALESAGTDTEGKDVFAQCTYSSAGVCTFFSDGSFSSGSSTCPVGLPQASGFGTTATTSSKSYSTGTSGHLSDNLAASADGTTSSNGKPSPAMIALLAINGVLVVGLIILGVLYFRKRRAAARISRHKTLYTSVSASGDPIFVAPTKLTQYEDKEAHAAAAAGDETPLTHGLTHGPYYDPHEPSSSPQPSRPASRLR